MFDPSKPVQTRDGRKARIVCTDFKSHTGETILALVDEDGEEMPYSFYDDGRFANFGDSGEEDLVNVPAGLTAAEVVRALRRVDGTMPVFINVDVNEPYEDDCLPITDVDTSCWDAVRLSIGR